MFITLEGPDGSGKTSQIPALAEFLREQGYPVLTTREPGGTVISNQIRAVLMNMENTSMCARTETLLFCAARAQLVDEVIRPHLEQGELVLSDRYADSTLAYQGYGHGNDLQLLRQILNFATGGLWPDLTLLLDVDSELGLRRRKDGGGEWNRLDAYELALHERVRHGYRQMALAEPERWVIVDGSRSFEAVQAELRRVVLERLQRTVSGHAGR
ncbi:MAG: dTMP kinase [Anaerolineaceae bacterium]|nr:dTMP kinase [Anaerolineaceae bacterium]